MKQTIKANLITVFFIILLLLSLVSGSANGLSVSAETDATAAYDSTDVMDDLSGMTIDGVAFSTSSYPANSSGSLQLLAFAEFGYNFYDDYQDDYGLYVYVYNPAKIAISASSTLNYIQLCAGEKTSENNKKYPLEFLSVSEGSGINGLYYKYKLTLTDAKKEAILSALDSSERVYEIGEIELLTIGDVNATSYEIGNKYTYSGYASGYGADTSAESTLTCTTAEDVVTISLNVTPTVYRPDGNNGTDEYTQDSLHSVYFSVPNEYITKYGEMYAVHATWRDAVLNPVLVTGNSTAYAAIEPYLGVDSSDGIDDLDYGYAVNYLDQLSVCTADYGYNFYSLGYWGLVSVENYISTLYMMFYDADADNAYIDPVTIQDKMLEMTKEYGGTKINGKYSSCLFESVADDWTEVNYTTTDETESLTQITVSESSWYKYLVSAWQYALSDNKYYVTSSETFDGIKRIYKVTDSDFSGSASSNAAALYINEDDYSDFKEYYDTAVSNDQTVYLFRYEVSNYWAAEATCVHKFTSIYGNAQWEDIDTNAYFAQETVNLDFDIIDLSFKQGEVITVISVVMSPIDVIPGYTPPLITTSDPSDFWKYGVAIIAALAVLWVLYYLIDDNQEKELNTW